MTGHSHDDHSHGGAGHSGGGQDCGHEHYLPSDGEQQSLYSVVDKYNVVALNAEREEMGQEIIKPWDQQDDETLYCQSEEDGELLIRVPFTDTVKLRSLTLRLGGGEGKMPDKLHVYANSSPDFSDLTSSTPTQTLDLVTTPSSTTYHVRIAKFSSVTHLSLHFPPPTSSSEEDESIAINFLSFAGEALRLRRDVPKGVVYESAPQMKDHKVHGTEQGQFSGLGL